MAEYLSHSMIFLSCYGHTCGPVSWVVNWCMSSKAVNLYLPDLSWSILLLLNLLGIPFFQKEKKLSIKNNTKLLLMIPYSTFPHIWTTYYIHNKAVFKNLNTSCMSNCQTVENHLIICKNSQLGFPGSTSCWRRSFISLCSCCWALVVSTYLTVILNVTWVIN